jgi:hypothetical protein
VGVRATGSKNSGLFFKLYRKGFALPVFHHKRNFDRQGKERSFSVDVLGLADRKLDGFVAFLPLAGKLKGRVARFVNPLLEQRLQVAPGGFLDRPFQVGSNDVLAAMLGDIVDNLQNKKEGSPNKAFVEG